MPSLIHEIRVWLAFYSRLPMAASGAAPDFSRVGASLPLAGAVLGACGALTLVIARATHIPPLVAATAAIATVALATGAMHEDGLADVADGFGGGATRDAKLAIMRDSRVGAFGVLALCLATLARVGALAAIVEHSLSQAALDLIFIGALSRVIGLAPMRLLPPARSDGAGASVGLLNAARAWRALGVAVGLGFFPWLAGVSILQIGACLVAAAFSVLLLTYMAQKHIRGFTGDVLGAAQQLAEIAALAALSAR